MSSSVHVDNKGKDILILGEGATPNPRIRWYHINSRRKISYYFYTVRK